MWASVIGDVEKLAAYLRSIDASLVGVHLPASEELDLTLEACRLADKQVVALDERPSVVVTADGAFDDGVVRCLKEEVDAAVRDARHVVVFRILGDAPLAPTLDAYLDVDMAPGRDVWFQDVRDGYVGALG